MADREYRDEQFRNRYKAELEQIKPQLDTLTSLSKTMAAQVQHKPEKKVPLRIGKVVRITATAVGAAAVIALAVALPTMTNSSTSESAAISSRPATATVETIEEAADEACLVQDDDEEDITNGVPEGTILGIMTTSVIESADNDVAEAVEEDDIEDNAEKHIDSTYAENAEWIWMLVNREDLSVSTEQLEDLYNNNSFAELSCFEGLTGKNGTYTALIDIDGQPDYKIFVGVYFNGYGAKSLKYAVIIDALNCISTVKDFLSQQGRGIFNNHSDEAYIDQALNDYRLIYH